MLQVQKKKKEKKIFKKEEEKESKKRLSLESRTLQTRTHTPSLPTLILGVWHGCRAHISKASFSLFFFPSSLPSFFLFIYLFF